MDQPLTRQRFQTEIQEIPGRPDVVKLVVQGNISYREAPEFREVILEEVANTRALVLVIDLVGVERIDTAGLAVLLEGLLAGRHRNLKMFLCQPSQSVLQLFEMAKLHDALEASCATPGEIMQRLMP